MSSTIAKCCVRPAGSSRGSPRCASSRGTPCSPCPELHHHDRPPLRRVDVRARARQLQLVALHVRVRAVPVVRVRAVLEEVVVGFARRRSPSDRRGRRPVFGVHVISDGLVRHREHLVSRSAPCPCRGRAARRCRSSARCSVPSARRHGRSAFVGFFLPVPVVGSTDRPEEHVLARRRPVRPLDAREQLVEAPRRRPAPTPSSTARRARARGRTARAGRSSR